MSDSTTATTESVSTSSDGEALTLATRRRSGLSKYLLGRDAVIIYALLIVIVIASVSIPRFATPTTVGFLLLDVIPILMLAMPMALIIISAEIDLSVASTVGLTSAVMGVLYAAGWDIWTVLGICIIVGFVAGAFNGFLITVLGLPSLAVTIGTLALYRGLALVVIGDNAVANFPPGLTKFFTSKIGTTGIPTVMIGVLVIIVFFAVLLHFTPFGRGLYALGYSTEAATFVGIRVGKAKFWLFVASGIVASLVGIYWTLRYSSARSDNATGLELAVIAAALLGGVSIFGGRGSIPGVIAGVLLIGTLNYGLRLAKIPDVALNIVTGSLLVLSVVAPSVVSWAKERSRLRRLHKVIQGPTPSGATSA
ncbi:ABC transporter permease [soil metagenome]